MVDVSGPQGAAAGAFEQCQKQYGDRHCHSTTQYIVTVVLGIY
jgi:hypothetical protein